MIIQPKKTVRTIARYPVPQAGRLNLLRLDKNENCVGWPPSVMKDMLSGLSRHFLTAYPEPGALYAKIAKWHGIGVDQLVVTAGSELAIRYLFEAYLEEGDEIVMLDPSFAMFEVYAKLCGATVVPICFNRAFHVSVKSIVSRISRRTKIVAIANPNNPTGTVLPQEGLVSIVREAHRHGALVLIDEAYFHFYGQTMLGYVGTHDNVVVTRTFSKACGAASVRLGYAIGHPEVVATIKKLQPIDHVSGFATLIGEYLIDHDHLIDEYVKQVEKGKAFLLKELSRMGLVAVGGFGNFILIDLSQRKKEIVSRLKVEGVLVGATLRLPAWSNHVRVTIGPPHLMRQFVRVLQVAMS